MPEKFLAETSKIINIENIENIDVIILDGGEYSTEEDFNILIKKKPKFICLDDSAVHKCKNIRNHLLHHADWELYKENLSQRNGWSTFVSKEWIAHMN